MANKRQTGSRRRDPAIAPATAKKSDPLKTWGIYVYFAADIPDKNLQDAVWDTMRTLASVGSSDTVKITAMIDMPGRNTEYYVIPKKPSDPRTTRWEVVPGRFRSNVDSASLDAILDFFAWSHGVCPAENIALIFWGHGYALDDYDPRIGQRPATHTQDLGRTADTFPGKRRGNELRLLYDATYNSVLNNRDFAQAIRDFTEQFNGKKPIQVLGLDCCNMAMAEILSELQGVAEYAIAAESGLPFQSWISAPTLQKFLDSPFETPRKFAVYSVVDFIDAMSRSEDSYVELAACNLNNFGNLEQAVKLLVDALLPAIEKYEVRKAVSQAWFNDVSFELDGLIDLSSFCAKLAQFVVPGGGIEQAVIDAAKKVQFAVEGRKQPYPDVGSDGGVVDYVQFTPKDRSRRISLSRGLSIWFPPWIQFPRVNYVQIQQSKDYLFDGYSRTRFATATGWDRFLRKLYVLTQV